jgi:adenosyl cobinamide kinase/adenosyl cobinamide phosphate guanylyltransferase
MTQVPDAQPFEDMKGQLNRQLAKIVDGIQLVLHG